MVKVPERSTSVSNWVRARDRDICQCCGHLGGCEVHHIQPVFLGGKAEPNNLISLCPMCHKYAPNDPSKFLEYQRKGGFGWQMVSSLKRVVEISISEQNPQVDLSEFSEADLKARQAIFEDSYRRSAPPSEAIANNLCGIANVSKKWRIQRQIINALRDDWQKWRTTDEITEMIKPHLDFPLEKKDISYAFSDLIWRCILLREYVPGKPRRTTIYKLSSAW